MTATLNAIPVGLPRAGRRQFRTRFWGNVSDGYPSPPSIWRLRQRVFVGAMVGASGDRAADTGYWLGESANGPNWIPRDSQMAVVSDNGMTGLSGSSRASDQNGILGSTIGIAGYAEGDVADGTVWAGYLEGARYASNVTAWGLEINSRNTQAATSHNPYDIFGNGGAHGINLAGGADNSYGEASANHSGFAIGIAGASRDHHWSYGIMVQAGSIVGHDGADGTTGEAPVLTMPRGHALKWFASDEASKVTIRSDLTSSDVNWTQYWSGDYLRFARNGATENVIRLGGVASAVNYLAVDNAATGNPPAITAIGSDTNVDIRLIPQGSGVVRFGTHSAIGAETVTGYITIKDSGGTSRKIAVVS